MTTEIISLSDYRKHLSSYTKRAQEKNIRYIVMVHAKPAFEIKAVDPKTLYLESASYKNEEWETFDSMESLVTDLDTYHTK